MYVLLGLVCCVFAVPFFYAVGPRNWEWAIAIPFLAANCVGGWTGLRGGRLYPAALIGVYIDLTFGIMLLLMVSATYSPTTPVALIPLLTVVVGIPACIAVERSQCVFSPILPVRGAWGRRFLAGLAVLLMQPASPGVLLLVYLNLVGSPKVPSMAAGLWLTTALIYLAPLYRRIVAGAPAHLTIPVTHSKARTLAEFLSADSSLFPQIERAFARFVVRCERSIYNALTEGGLEPGDAGRRCRAILRELWFNRELKSYDELDLTQLEALLHNRKGPRAPRRCEKLLIDLALEEVATNSREATAAWIDGGEDLRNLQVTAGASEEITARRVHLGTLEVLGRIAGSLPARVRRASPTALE